MFRGAATTLAYKAIPMIGLVRVLAEEAGFAGGGSGWTAAALLGAVLYWVARHVDALMKSQAEEREAFGKALKDIIDHCQDENARWAQHVKKPGDST